MAVPRSTFAFLRRFAIACVLVLAIALGGFFASDAYERKAFNGTKTVHITKGVLHAVAAGKPANYLLIGVDTRSNVDAGSNADTMMVLHVEPSTGTGYLVSFPRDLVVDIPGHGEGQLNSAYASGGAHGGELVIKTLQQNFAPLTIQHYLEVDFQEFQNIVNAIGHINLYFPTPAHDPFLALDVNQAGCVSVDGLTALHYARSRHYYVPDDPKHPVPWNWHWTDQRPGHEQGYANGWSATGSDIDRIPRQQYFLRTLAQAALEKTASKPTRLIGLLDAVSKDFTHDDTLTLTELKSLIRTFNGFDPRRVEMTTLPWSTDPNNANRVVVKQPQASFVIANLANKPAPKVFFPKLEYPGDVRVRVVNGSGINGLAAKVLSQFEAAGYKAAGPAADADRSDYAKTVVQYQPGKQAAGLTVLITTGKAQILQAKTAAGTLGGDVLVVIGRDWTTLQHKFTPPPSTTTTSSTSSTSPTSSALSGATTTTSTSTPRTTVDTRFVPVDPATGGPLIGCP